MGLKLPDRRVLFLLDALHNPLQALVQAKAGDDRINIEAWSDIVHARIPHIPFAGERAASLYVPLVLLY